MSLFGSMYTSISGMQAQSNRLASVGENVANASTTGYKRSDATFSSMVMPTYNQAGGYNSGNYQSGYVETTIRRSITQQGDLSYTTSETSLAIQGQGFFVVQDANGKQYLSRAGDFQKDDEGYLLNSGGYRLTGYKYDDSTGGTTGAPEAIQIGRAGLSSSPSTGGIFDVNMPIDAKANGNYVNTPPSSNGPYSAYTKMMTVNNSSSGGGMDNTTDIYFTKLADNQWEVTTYVSYGSASTGFPYDLASGNVHMATTTLTFDPSSGALVSGNPKITPDPADNYYFDFSSLMQQSGGSYGGVKMRENFVSATPKIDTTAGEVPASANVAGASYATKSTFQGYAGLPSNVAIDMYVTKTGDNTWEAAFYNKADSATGGLPYGTAGSAPLATRTFTFDPTSGAMTSGGGTFNVAIPGVGNWNVDMSDVVSKADYGSTNEDGISISVDLPSSATAVQTYYSGTTPAKNQANSTYTNKTALTAFDNAGRAVQLDMYYTKISDDTWEVSVFNRNDSLTGGFPYGAAGSPPLATTTVKFDPATNKLAQDQVLDVPLGDGQTVALDMSGSTQLSTAFTVTEAKIDGSKPSAPKGYSISPDGLVSATYEDGTTIPIYMIAMADVMSPNNMTAVDGTAFLTNADSGPAMYGYAGVDGMGTLKSGAYENSNVDLADQLTNMIEAQRVYTANSKAYQTGSEMFDTLNNLKR